MKTLGSHLAVYLRDRAARRNLRALGKLGLLFIAIVLLYTTLFHVLMAWEGQEHSWLSGLYWVLVVMSTLGFGDITFASDVGRLFSLLVLLSGVLLLLVVLPFAFIQYFYAPYLEARLRNRAPREVPKTLRDHVIVADYDAIGRALAERLAARDVPHVVALADAAQAAELHSDGHRVATGDVGDRAFLERLGVARARLVLANVSDTVNTNVTLTVHEISPEVPIAAIIERDESEDVLTLAGATHVLPLKRWLGEQLANRVGGANAQTNVVGYYRDLLLAELPARHTPLAGRTLRQVNLRAIAGVSAIGVWERGRLRPVRPDTPLSDASVLVVTGTRAQLDRLDDLLLIYDANPHPVLVVGGGKVGRAAVRALQDKEIDVHLVERDPSLCARMRGKVPVFEGDAADFDLLAAAGIREAPAVVLTTHDDAMNIYLAAYCRGLNPDVRIVSRITYEHNVEAVHRAGANFALSYTALGVESVMARVEGRELNLLGAGLALHTLPLPRALAGQTLAESGIGEKTGLLVLAVQRGEDVIANPPPDTRLHEGSDLIVLGDAEQRARFAEAFA
ncbi:MAG: potassium channel family protein [Rubricoccaceae bacterium]